MTAHGRRRSAAEALRIQQALELLASDRYLEKGMGLDGPDRAQACRDLL
jgi:hypothetical protein